jgi:hypothetical protein
MTNERATVYEDDGILCDDKELTIRRYYLWWGAKRIPYTSIRSVERLPMTGVNKIRRWRIWGSGDFVHWWNFDAGRPKKEMALVIHTGGRVLPTITPDDPDAVESVISGRRAAR